MCAQHNKSGARVAMIKPNNIQANGYGYPRKKINLFMVYPLCRVVFVTMPTFQNRHQTCYQKRSGV